MLQSMRNLLSTAVLALGLLMTTVGALAQSAPHGRIAVFHMTHETTTFVDRPTDRAVFEAAGPPLQGDDVLLASTYTRGFARMARLLDLVPLGLTSPRAPLEFSSTGWITREAFEHYVALMMADLRAADAVAGVYLALHGAMAVDGVPRPEAEIARRIREQVGASVPIVVSYDLHANEDEEIARYVNAVMGTKRYPHYDEGYMGARAAIFLKQVLADGYRPQIVARKIPIILPTVRGDTAVSPLMDIMERARIWEERRPETYVSVLLGYPWSDVPDVGMSLFVTSNGDAALAEEIADDMYRYIWQRREEFATRSYARVDQAVQQATRAQKAGEIPVVLLDYSDRLGDATWGLKQLLESGAERFLVATLTDADAIAEIACDPTPGRRLQLSLGGTLADSSGSPVEVTAELESVRDLADSSGGAVLNLGNGNRVIVTPILRQFTEPAQIRRFGIDDRDHDIIVLKARVHFRRGFNVGDYAAHAIPFEPPEPFLGTVHLDALPYQNIPQNLYPMGR